MDGENGIGYMLGKDGMYYTDLRSPEGTHYEISRYGRMRWDIGKPITEDNISSCCWMAN